MSAQELNKHHAADCLSCSDYLRAGERPRTRSAAGGGSGLRRHPRPSLGDERCRISLSYSISGLASCNSAPTVLGQTLRGEGPERAATCSSAEPLPAGNNIPASVRFTAAGNYSDTPRDAAGPRPGFIPLIPSGSCWRSPLIAGKQPVLNVGASFWPMRLEPLVPLIVLEAVPQLPGSQTPTAGRPTFGPGSCPQVRKAVGPFQGRGR